MLWNNQPDREAFGLVRKGVGQSTVLRAVETPYPKVNPIQSNPVDQVQKTRLVLKCRQNQAIKMFVINLQLKRRCKDSLYFSSKHFSIPKTSFTLIRKVNDRC